jgi:D-inositol-3-phosphate glycosyltransferase
MQVKNVIIIGSAYPLRGGLSAYNERLAREFISQGYSTEIYTFSLQYPGFLFPGKTQYSDQPPPKDLRIRVRINSVNPLNWISVGNEIRKKRPDLVIIKFWIPFMAPCLGTIARMIRRNRHTKIISIIDNIIPHEKRPGDKMFASYWVNSVDGFIAMSKNVLSELELFDHKKPKIYCPHPLYDNFGDLIDKTEARKMLGLDPAQKYILFFGFIRDYKGLDLLLRAMADQQIRKAGIKLLVAGEFYTDPKPYFDIISRENIQDSVIMSNDFIPDNDVAKYFCAADLVVQPYKNATQSGVTQIAYHFNKPMITTDVGGLAEMVPDGKVGFVINPESSEIAGAILKYYKDDLETTFTSCVMHEKEKYSWNNLVDSLIHII